jgi:CelD/BcsL family acetyltransferase involved in cellulose biosynthesis
MFQVFARAAGHRPELWAAVDPGGRPLALLLPVRITLMDGLLSPLTSRAVVWGSVLCAPGAAGKEALVKVLCAYQESVRGRCLFTELRNLSDLGDLQALLAAQGFAYEEYSNYLVDLERTPEDILQSMGRRTRKQIRRGLRKGEARITVVGRPEEIMICHGLLAETYAQARVPLADRSLFDALFEVLYPKGMVKFLLARVGDAHAAASVELIYKDTIYGWYGGMDRAYTQFTPNELLTWHILSWGARNGYRVYDFGGAGKPDEEYGVRDFKAKFGGELVCYGRNTCVHAPVRLAFSKAGYKFYRSLAGFRASVGIPGA